MISRSPVWACSTVPVCLALCGCFRITINPECPDQIEEGQTGDLIAHERTPGQIPTYLWEADPAEAVTMTGAHQPNASFEALRPGQVVFTLTAADGLFQMIDTCTTTIIQAGGNEPPDLSVSLVANPTEIVLGNEDPSVLLTCTSTGTTPANLTIDQLDGPQGSLTTVSPGTVVAILPPEAANYTFRCLGTDVAGNRSDPAVARVTVSGGTQLSPQKSRNK